MARVGWQAIHVNVVIFGILDGLGRIMGGMVVIEDENWPVCHMFFKMVVQPVIENG